MANTDKVGPSRAWFILPFVFLLAAVVLAGLGIASFAHFVASDFSAIQPGSPISATRDGFTVYTNTEAGSTRPADLLCTATGKDGAVQLQNITGKTTLGNGETTFVAIASSPSDLPAGNYVVACTSAFTRAQMPLFLGPRFDVAAVGRMVAFNVIAPLLLGFCGVVIFVIVAVARYRAHRKVISAAQVV
jgi:hypothetical protein